MAAAHEQHGSAEVTYPGEDGPLEMRRGGQPITADEALGVLRRRVREANERTGKNDPIPAELPLPREAPMSSFRVPARDKAFAQAKAEMEGRTLTEAVREFFKVYGASEPGAQVTMTLGRAAKK